jgi:hypothetical protein
LSSRLAGTAAANARWNYSTNEAGCSVRFDSSPCWRSLARAGLPGFIIFCRRGERNEWRMQAGLQVARPPKGGRSGVQITLSLCGAGWRSHRLANSCRQPIEQGECLREYIGIWRFESARRSLIDRFLASTCRSPERKRMNGECRQDYRKERSRRRSRKVGCSNHPFRPRMEVAQSLSCRPLSPDRMNRTNACETTGRRGSLQTSGCRKA